MDPRVGATNRGAKVFTTRLRWRRRGTYLGIISHGAELGATSYGAEVAAASARWKVTRRLVRVSVVRCSTAKAKPRPSLPALVSAVLTLAYAACPSGLSNPKALFTHMSLPLEPQGITYE